MSFSIDQMIVDGDQNIVALNWSYTNSDGTLSNQHKLAQPYGSVILTTVTETIAIGWLQDQLQNTVEEFDAAIAKRKAETEYANTLVAYTKNENGTFEAASGEPVE
jgi:hypothetical protein